MAAKKSIEKRLARQSDRDHAASLVDQFHEMMLRYPEPEKRELLLSSWIQHLNAELECFAANGTWEGCRARVLDENGWPAGWVTHKDRMREQLRELEREFYAQLKARGVSQLDAIAQVAETFGISEDTVASDLYRKK